MSELGFFWYEIRFSRFGRWIIQGRQLKMHVHLLSPSCELGRILACPAMVYKLIRYLNLGHIDV